MEVKTNKQVGTIGITVDLSTEELIVLAQAWDELVKPLGKITTQSKGFRDTVRVDVELLRKFDTFMPKLLNDTRSLDSISKDLFEEEVKLIPEDSV